MSGCKIKEVNLCDFGVKMRPCTPEDHHYNAYVLRAVLDHACKYQSHHVYDEVICEPAPDPLVPPALGCYEDGTKFFQYYSDKLVIWNYNKYPEDEDDNPCNNPPPQWDLCSEIG